MLSDCFCLQAGNPTINSTFATKAEKLFHIQHQHIGNGIDIVSETVYMRLEE